MRLTDKLISADNLINCLRIMSTKNDSTVWEQCIEIVNSLPDEQKRGYWIHRHYINGNKDSIEMFVCSECREEFSYDAETGVSITDYEYCPNCGAEMGEVIEWD